jgi:hypothetical protein
MNESMNLPNNASRVYISDIKRMNDYRQAIMTDYIIGTFKVMNSLCYLRSRNTVVKIETASLPENEYQKTS